MAPSDRLADAAAPIRTDSAEYTVQHGPDVSRLRIGMRYTNTTDAPVYLPTCLVPQPPVLQKQVAGQWVDAYSPTVLACYGPPLVIQPGETFSDTLDVVAGRPGNNLYPKFEVPSAPGTYRLVRAFLRTLDAVGADGIVAPPEPLPLALRVSNEFRIRE